MFDMARVEVMSSTGQEFQGSIYSISSLASAPSLMVQPDVLKLFLMILSL